MTRIVHLTDLHFGRERGELVGPLAEALRAAEPELVVVTGDLTHRARPAQYAMAMAFLRGLGLPFIAMPGNHDVPLYNLVARVLFPFRAWRRGVAREMTPVAEVGRLRVLSANTADPFRWRRGVLRDADRTRIMADLRAGGGEGVSILACHHPFVEPPGFQRGETRGAAEALPEFAREGVQVILAGHLHHWEIGLGITPEVPRAVLILQTGTALCGREGERDHGFSVLDFAPGDVAITPWIIDEAAGRFMARPAQRFVRQGGRWHIAAPG